MKESNRHVSSKQHAKFLLQTIWALLVPVMILAGLLTQHGNLDATTNGSINTNLQEDGQSVASSFSAITHTSTALVNTRDQNDDCAFFEATAVDQMVYLQWTTNSTCPAKWYVVEKSHNNKSFTKFLRIEASAARPESTGYLEIDRDLWSGVSYYRFLIIDEHGNCTYSQLSVIASMEIATTNKRFSSKPGNITKGRQEPIGMSDEDILIVVRNRAGVFRNTKVRILSTDAGQFVVADLDDVLDEEIYLVIASSDDRLKNKKILIDRGLARE